MSTLENAPIVWCVWKDSFQEEVLAVEKTAMSDALCTQLTQEKTPIKEVAAADRRSAVRLAYPEAFEEKLASRRPRVH